MSKNQNRVLIFTEDSKRKGQIICRLCRQSITFPPRNSHSISKYNRLRPPQRTIGVELTQLLLQLERRLHRHTLCCKTMALRVVFLHCWLRTCLLTTVSLLCTDCYSKRDAHGCESVNGTSYINGKCYNETHLKSFDDTASVVRCNSTLPDTCWNHTYNPLRDIIANRTSPSEDYFQ